MLNNIITIYIIKLIFSILNPYILLDLAKYNIFFQTLFDITIIHYEEYTGRYIIFEKDGKGKEYDMNHYLLYEGEFLHGKRHGKGRGKEPKNEYYYEGEYRYGKKHGKGNETANGPLIYEGEYSNGVLNGKGKEYEYFSWKLIFDGEFRNGKRWNGSGVWYFNDNPYELKNGSGFIQAYHRYDNLFIYEGFYLDGMCHGKGKEYFLNQIIAFEGLYSIGKKWTGTGYDNLGIYSYEIKDGKGIVKEYLPNGQFIFCGQYINGERNGWGKEYFLDKLFFEGEYLNGKRHGKGKELSMGHITFDGEFLFGKKHGIGKEYNEYNDILLFEGYYINDRKNGPGKEYDYNGNLIFEGEYLFGYKKIGREYIKGKLYYEGIYCLNNKYHGKFYDGEGNVINKLIFGNGKLKDYNSDGFLIFEGEYKNGKKIGKVKEYYRDGVLFFEGDYLNGLKNGKGIEYFDKDRKYYEGSYLNEKKHGYGKLYDYQGNIKYEGEFIDGEPARKYH